MQNLLRICCRGTPVGAGTIGRGSHAMISRLTTSAALLFCLTSTAASQTHSVIEKDATVLGFKIHYLEAGNGSPVVLLHGLGGDGSRWGPHIRAPGAGFRVITPPPN